MSLENAVWVSAMLGRVTSFPAATSYGFMAVVSDRFLFSCTEDGVPMFQRFTYKRNNSHLTALENNFFTTVTNSSSLNFINPSGTVLWSRDAEFEITDRTFQGRDGRLIVHGANNVACYGLNGTRKWTIETDYISEIPICELVDGSLILFMAQKESGKTEALRVSPFGEILDEFVFNKNVVAAATCANGVAMTFSDGHTSLLTVKKGKVMFAWSIPSMSDSGSIIYSLSKNRAALICRTSNGSIAQIVSTENGNIINTLFFPDINSAALTVIQDTISNGREVLVLADSRSICSIALDGVIMWSASLPERETIPWEKIIYTKNNFVIFFTTTWAVVAFKTGEQILPNSIKTSSSEGRGSYSDFYDTERKFIFLQFQSYVDSDFTDGTMSEILSDGDYGRKEKGYNSYVMSTAETYYDSLSKASHFPTPNQFTRDVSGTDSLLKLLPLFETSDAAKILSNILSREENVTHIRTILKCISDFPYDSDGNLLNVIDKILMQTNSRDDATLVAICDALYSMCRFIGNESLNSGIHDLLVSMLSIQYSATVRNHVRNALADLADELGQP